VLRRRRAGRWMRTTGGPDVRHRSGLAWDVVPVPHPWHACRPQTVQLHHEGSLLTGSYYCPCGAVTDRPGGWCCRSTRRHRDPAGLCRSRMPQFVRTRVVAGTTRHSGARHHPRFHPVGRA